MIKATPDVVEIATALYVGVFNIDIALGAWAGGQIMDGFGLTGNLWLAGGLATVALLLIIGIGLNERKAKVGD